MGETVDTLTVKEAAQRLRVGASEVYRLIRMGALAVVVVGTGEKRKTYRITPAALAACLDQRETRMREPVAEEPPARVTLQVRPVAKGTTRGIRPVRL